MLNQIIWMLLAWMMKGAMSQGKQEASGDLKDKSKKWATWIVCALIPISKHDDFPESIAQLCDINWWFKNRLNSNTTPRVSACHQDEDPSLKRLYVLQRSVEKW